jgi:LmbE family N-acetylglucosaminyl deacetylase
MFEAKQLAQQILKGKRPVSLRNCSISPELKILVLAPHPDDFDAITITLKYFQENGNLIFLLVLTGASTGVDDSFLSDPTKENKEKVREIEQKKSLEYFGFPSSNVSFLYLTEDKHGDLILNEECQSTISKKFEEIRPDAIFLPYGKDTNPSHRRTFKLVRDITKEIDKPIIAFYNQDPKTTQIRLDTYIDFDKETALWKRKMLCFHQSQQARNLQTRGIGFDDRILNVNAEIAREINIKSQYAEGFQIELLDRAT